MARIALSSLLRRHRHGAGLSIDALAQRSGISARAISDIERGRSTEPQAHTIRALADALGLAGAARSELYESSRPGRERAPAEAEPRPLLLPDSPDLVGRGGELARLDTLLSLPGRKRGPVVISGSGGVGKTALAVRAAHAAGDDFPDGRFFVDLRPPGDVPTDPYVVQHRLLHALGTAPDAIPEDPDDRGGLLAGTLARRRALLVLDNAANEEQIRPLLPGNGETATLITSRRALTGLARSGHVRLGPLADADAAAMLRAVIHAAAPDDQQTAQLHELARLCGNYPLALRIAGSRLLTRPGWTLATLIDWLSDAERRLGRLTAGDLQIRTAFTESYQRLEPDAQLVFRRLALAPGREVDAALAAVLSELPLDGAAARIDELIEAELLLALPDQRTGLHDLVRLFAREQLRLQDTSEQIRAARARLSSWSEPDATEAGGQAAGS